jgi:hypothetical protein
VTRPFKSLRVILYFAFAKKEALTPRDMEIKLGLTVRSVPTLLRTACRDGLLAKERDASGSVTYRAGPELLTMVNGMERWL